MSVLIAGFLIGMRHALDADHIAALSVFLAEKPSPQQAARQGALWGIGHSIMLLAVGFAFIMLDIKLTAQVASLLELAVGIMLIGLGLDLLRRYRREIKQISSKRVLGVGLMHGLAGSSALILLTLSTIDAPRAALIYIVLFGLGSILGMTLLSVALAWPLQRASQHSDMAQALTRGAACIASIGLGLILVNDALGVIYRSG